MAFMLNVDFVKDKVVLDVGAGTGILSLWAAKAGAAKVYAIEYTNMAHNARKLLESNGVSDIVTVFQGDADEIELPSKVDIVVSEWMGAFLLRESMLDVVVRMRDKWMSPGGTMFPSHAKIYLAAVNDEEERAMYEKDRFNVLSDIEWTELENSLKDNYQVDYAVLKEAYQKELDMDLHVGKIVQMKNYQEKFIGSPVNVKELDLNTCTLDDVKGVSATPIDIDLGAQFHEDMVEVTQGDTEDKIEKTQFERDPITVSAFVGWFTVDFNGTSIDPLPNPVHLTTHPEWGYTHWGQIISYLREALIVKKRFLSCAFEMNRKPDKWRNYDITLVCQRDVDNAEPLRHSYSLVSF